jgi:hypothetical protein
MYLKGHRSAGGINVHDARDKIDDAYGGKAWQATLDVYNV